METEVEIKCPKCRKMLNRQRVVKNKYVCYECGAYFRVRTNNRIRMVADRKSFVPWFEEIQETNPLQYEGYEEKLAQAREKSGVNEAVTVGRCRIYGEEAVIGVCEALFMMGSMGVEAGETVTRSIEHAYRFKLPLIIFCASGGARMQEGIVSLMQMAKTSAALERYKKKGGLYIVYFTHPTTGGVSASFAGLGDINLAEPNALVGFAGPKVIEQTIGQKLPDGFQRAEYLEKHGFVDKVVSRDKMRETISQILMLHDIPRIKG